MNGCPGEGQATPLENGGPWVISSFAEARAILVSADARVPADIPPPAAGGGAAGELVERGVHLRGLWMWGCHTDRRAACHKAAAAALGPGPVDSLAPYLESRAAALPGPGDEAGEVDLVAGFARPLVRDALMELFGVDPAARAALQAQVEVMAGFIPGNGSGGTARYFALAATARLLEKVWSKPLPPNAAASRTLLGAVEAGELSLDEALAQATLLLFGNSYTTLDALAGLMARLAGEPQLWRAARGGSLPVAGLVEESLRLGPPEHLVLFRDAAGEISLPGGIIPRGARIVLPLDRLNRDPACFERPDSFEPQRSGPPHLAFGAGRHMCVGLHLARAVIRIAAVALIRRLPEWPAETRIGRAPGILGGSSVASLSVPAGTLRAC
ncbi:MAG TPA: cytochrome P450 [Allosphingosinicella sp.]|nr:cytochrome P450 [Allosphingosinicella sp.]